MMTAACIGTFVMADSGLLDHQHATTTWWLAPLFRKRYPHVQLDESNMIVQSGRFVTAGAALSHMDLALWLVRSIRCPATGLSHGEIPHRRFQVLAIGVCADRSSDPRGSSRPALRSMGPRQTEPRVFPARCGKGRRIQQTNTRAPDAERARQVSSVVPSRICASNARCTFLKTGQASVDEVAAQVGYADGATLRGLLRQRVDLGIREIRRMR